MALLQRCAPLRAHLLKQTSSSPPTPPTFAHLLRLPSSIRTFHVTPRSQFIEPILGITHTFLQTVHHTSYLPWCATIPLLALLTRTLLLPLGLISRHASVRRNKLSPLLDTWGTVLRSKAMKSHNNLGPRAVQTVYRRAMFAKKRELYARWDAQYWKQFLPMLQMPIWLVNIECVRRMCGTGQGVLGMFAGGLGTAKEKVAEGSAASETVDSYVAGQEAWEVIESLPVTDVVAVQNTALDTTLSTPSATDVLSPIGLEPSFATEGMLWFPNLLLPDPNLILPFALSGILLCGLLPSASSRGANGKIIPLTKGTRRLRNILGMVALAIGPLTLQAPSGLLLYWVSSSGFALVQHVFMDRWIPLKAVLTPCQTRKPEKPMGDDIGGGTETPKKVVL